MKYVYVGILIMSLLSCRGRESTTMNRNPSDAEIIDALTSEIHEMYAIYEKSQLGWVDYYQDEFMRIGADGSVTKPKARDMRDTWRKIYQKNKVIVRSHGEPQILPSSGQAVSWNTVSEIFISGETGDTISDNSGTFIAVWRKQKDGSWKIALETYQAE